MRSVDDEISRTLHPWPSFLVVADVVQAPLARLRLDLVCPDELGQYIRIDVQEDVEDCQGGSTEPAGQFAPVVLAQDRLHCDEVLPGQASDFLGKDRDQFAPRSQILEVLKLVVA